MSLKSLALSLVLSLCGNHIKPPPKNEVTAIVFKAPVDEQHIDELVGAMEKAQESHPKFLLVIIDTPGGSLGEAAKFIRAVEMSNVPVHCVADNMAASAGFVMLQGCTTRGMTTRSTLLFHQAVLLDNDGMGRLGEKELRGLVSAIETLDAAMIKFCAERMGMPVDEATKKLDRVDWWMAAPEALHVHAVDYTVSSLKAVIQSLENTGEPYPVEPKKIASP